MHPIIFLGFKHDQMKGATKIIIINLKHNYKVCPTIIIIINSVYSDPAHCVIQKAGVTIREEMEFLTPFVSRSAMSPVSRVEYPW